MITLLLAAAGISAASYITAHRATRTRVKAAAAMVATGFLGIAIVAALGALIVTPHPWAFPLIFAAGVAIEVVDIRRKRINPRVQAQLDELDREIGGQQ